MIKNGNGNGKDDDSYFGNFDVKNDALYLEAKKIVIQEKEIKFNLQGKDYYGIFEVSGTAIKTKHLHYWSPDRPVYYRGYDDPETASIRFDEFNFENEQLLIKGCYVEDSDPYYFSGKLDRFLPPRKPKSRRKAR
jgi:hypothetical protein